MKSVTEKWEERAKKFKADIAAIRKKLTRAEWDKLRTYFYEQSDNEYRGPG